MRNRDTAIVTELYYRHVTEPGYAHPTTPAELQAIVLASGVNVDLRADAPEDFDGIQIGSTVYVNGRLDPARIMAVMAHEWFHALRRPGPNMPRGIWHYAGDTDRPRCREEALARLFERQLT